MGSGAGTEGWAAEQGLRDGQWNRERGDSRVWGEGVVCVCPCGVLGLLLYGTVWGMCGMQRVPAR